jgi:hypothetical protein
MPGKTGIIIVRLFCPSQAPGCPVALGPESGAGRTSKFMPHFLGLKSGGSAAQTRVK